MTNIDKRALNRWIKSDISYNNYSFFISKKTNRFKLTFIDLLYVSNFKGGNATINEKEEIILEKLIFYGNILKDINESFRNKKLYDTNDNEYKQVIDFSKKLLDLTDKKSKNKIDGFNSSYVTTLLHFYFPNLYPILDRRVLMGLGLVTKSDINSQGQVKKIEIFYPRLINEFRKQTVNKTIREVDKEFFIKNLDYKR